jgi:phospholipid/cholesterol/gamma-HCH transport system substrate-binding protein
MFTTRNGRRLGSLVALGVVALLVCVGALWWVFRDLGAKRVTAFFNDAVGVYAGSDLRILGVQVGTVDSVTPIGTRVAVIMTLDGGISVPADADAVVVSPSVVSDRYVQLTPAYTGGPALADGALIPVDRTATPVELDKLYDSLNELTTALGPGGANKNGALSDLLTTGAANLDGNGKALGTLIQQLSAATRTLSGYSGDLFGTIDNLRKFTTMLKDNDAQVRDAVNQLAQVSGFLAADRQDLAAALNTLATALGQVRTFIQDNRTRLKSNVDKLAGITQVLVNQRASLAEALDVFPLDAANVLNAFDPGSHTLNGRVDLNEFSSVFPTSGGPTAQSGATAPILPLPAADSLSGGGQ